MAERPGSLPSVIKKIDDRLPLTFRTQSGRVPPPVGRDEANWFEDFAAGDAKIYFRKNGRVYVFTSSSSFNPIQPPGPSDFHLVLLDDEYLYWAKDKTLPVTQRSAGIRWHVTGVDPDRFEIDTALTTRVVLDANGLVGINTITPTSQLEVVSGASGRVVARFDAASGQSVNLTEWRNSALSPRTFITKEGYIGFSTTGSGTQFTTGALSLDVFGGNISTEFASAVLRNNAGDQWGFGLANTANVFTMVHLSSPARDMFQLAFAGDSLRPAQIIMTGAVNSAPITAMVNLLGGTPDFQRWTTSSDVAATPLAKVDYRGQLYLPNGAAGFPAYSFMSDNGGGLFRAGANDIDIVSGTTAPRCMLSVQTGGVFVNQVTGTNEGSGLNQRFSVDNDSPDANSRVQYAARVMGLSAGNATYAVNNSSNGSGSVITSFEWGLDNANTRFFLAGHQQSGVSFPDAGTDDFLRILLPTPTLWLPQGNQLLRMSGTSGYTEIKAGSQTTNISYIWPIAAPAVDGYVLSSTTAGQWSWVSPSSGATGPTGPIGPPGRDGEPGEDGVMGPTGATGATGATGSTGPQGIQGIPGAMGLPGDDGEEGQIGPIGPQGPTGATGSTGSTGPQGAQGIPGAMGLPGDDGQDGDIGPPGPRGPIGPQGLQGAPGQDGEDDSSAWPQGVGTGVGGTTRGVGTTNYLPLWVNGPAGLLGDSLAQQTTLDTNPVISVPELSTTTIGSTAALQFSTANHVAGDSQTTRLSIGQGPGNVAVTWGGVASVSYGGANLDTGSGFLHTSGGAITTAGGSITTAGGNLDLTPTGTVDCFGVTIENAGLLTLWNTGGNFSTTFQGSASQTGNVAYTLPIAQGGGNTFLRNNGSGALSWQTVPPGPPGVDGADGEDSLVPGPPGPSGARGLTGPIGPPGLDADDSEPLVRMGLPTGSGTLFNLTSPFIPRALNSTTLTDTTLKIGGTSVAVDGITHTTTASKTVGAAEASYLLAPNFPAGAYTAGGSYNGFLYRPTISTTGPSSGSPGITALSFDFGNIGNGVWGDWIGVAVSNALSLQAGGSATSFTGFSCLSSPQNSVGNTTGYSFSVDDGAFTGYTSATQVGYDILPPAQAVGGTDAYGLRVQDFSGATNKHGFAVSYDSNLLRSKYLYWGSALSTALASRDGGIRMNSTTSLDLEVGTTVRFSMTSSALTTTNKFTTYGNVATVGWGVPGIHDVKSLTGKTADIVDTNFTNAGAAGFYRISVYLVDTTGAVGAGAVTCNIKYTDAAAAQTVTVGPVGLVTLGTFAQSTIFVQLASGNITYGTTHTGIFSTAQYALYLTCERLN